MLVRTLVPREDPVLPTATGLFRGAGWAERETHEMFGVVFDGHPGLAPLLLPEGFEGHPLRKDFPLAARAAQEWPGARDPRERPGAATPESRKLVPRGRAPAASGRAGRCRGRPGESPGQAAWQTGRHDRRCGPGPRWLDLPAPRSRGVIGLLEENCTVCMLCARECPDWCIYIESHKQTLPAPEGGRPRVRNVLDRFAIDFSLCMYCGICVEVCPYDALFWSPEFGYPETGIGALTHERDRLRDWMWTVPPPPAHDPGAPLPREAQAAGPGAGPAVESD